MVNRNSKEHFTALLEECRAECKKYICPKKDIIIEQISKFPNVYQAWDEAFKKVDKNKKAPKQVKDQLIAERDAWKAKKEQVETEILDVLEPILQNDIVLNEPNKLKVNLMKCAIINQATPAGLAKFSDEVDPDLVHELLGRGQIMMLMLLGGGAKNGKYGEAYKIYKQIIGTVQEDEYETSHKRLAMAIALEHGDPIHIFDLPKVRIDPIERFRHYVTAHRNGELDPAFGYFSTYEYRRIVDCDASEADMKWGRDHLKRYKPELVVLADRKLRYAQQVDTDVGIRPPNWTSTPRTYPQIVSGGGKCGPRAWYGRFQCKTHGIPTWGVLIPGHAAMSRWTPNGWEIILGGGWPRATWKDRRGNDFLTDMHARAFKHDKMGQYFRKVTLLDCMAEVYNENFDIGERNGYDPQYFWRSLANGQRRLWQRKTLPKHFKRGPDDNECDTTFPSQIQDYITRVDEPKDDNVSTLLKDGTTIRIPACAFNFKARCIVAQKSFEGGGIIQFPGGRQCHLNYKMPTNLLSSSSSSSSEREYEVTCKVCNVHLEHDGTALQFVVDGNDSNVIETTVPYTVGEWGYTAPVKLKLTPDSKLIIKRPEIRPKHLGLTLREILLKPC